MANIRCLKNKHNPYVQLNKKTLEISSLSFGAKGLWSYLLSRPDNWTANVKALCREFKEGKHRIYSLLRELKEHELCFYSQPHKGGRLQGGEYVIFETPEQFKEFLLLPENQSSENLNPENQRPNKEGTIIKNEKNEKNPPKGGYKKPLKNTYGEFQNVQLTGAEYEKLEKYFGDLGTKSRIEKLSSYIASKGVKYKSHYATILSWERRDRPGFTTGEGPKEHRTRNLSKRTKTDIKTHDLSHLFDDGL